MNHRPHQRHRARRTDDPRPAGQRRPPAGRNDPDGVLQEREEVIQLFGCTLQRLRGASFCRTENIFLSFCRCTWYTILYNFIRRYFSMPENYITCQDEKGSINISEDVVAAMVRAAITEVDGVAGVATSTGTELAERVRSRSSSALPRSSPGTMPARRRIPSSAASILRRWRRKTRCFWNIRTRSSSIISAG